MERQQMKDEFMDAFGISKENTIQNRTLQFANLVEEVVELGFEMGLSMPQIYGIMREKFDKNAQKYSGKTGTYSPIGTLDAQIDIEYFALQIRRITGLTNVFDEGFRRVHAANMAKMIDGRIIKNEDGKVVKPEEWQEADLSDLV